MTRVCVDVLYELEIDVPCDQLEEFALMARLATGIVRRGMVPTLTHPQTGESVEAKVLYYGESMPGCPLVGWRGDGEAGAWKGAAQQKGEADERTRGEDGAVGDGAPVPGVGSRVLSASAGRRAGGGPVRVSGG